MMLSAMMSGCYPTHRLQVNCCNANARRTRNSSYEGKHCK